MNSQPVNTQQLTQSLRASEAIYRQQRSRPRDTRLGHVTVTYVGPASSSAASAAAATTVAESLRPRGVRIS